jgi:hypothetical protein
LHATCSNERARFGHRACFALNGLQRALRWPYRTILGGHKNGDAVDEFEASELPATEHLAQN